MLAYIYKQKYYRIIKSGFLLDYFIKKYIIFYWTTWLIQFNYIFNDKYFIEHISKILYNNYKLFNNFLTQLQNVSSIYLINFIVLTIVLSVLLFNLWLW